MYERFGYPGLFGAYNAGPGRYAAYAAGHGSLPTETHVYLASVTGNAVPAARLAAKPSTVPVNTLFAVQRDQGARSSVSALPALFVVQHDVGDKGEKATRSEEHKSELQSLMRIPDAVFCVK